MFCIFKWRDRMLERLILPKLIDKFNIIPTGDKKEEKGQAIRQRFKDFNKQMCLILDVKLFALPQ